MMYVTVFVFRIVVREVKGKRTYVSFFHAIWNNKFLRDSKKQSMCTVSYNLLPILSKIPVHNWPLPSSNTNQIGLHIHKKSALQ